MSDSPKTDAVIEAAMEEYLPDEGFRLHVAGQLAKHARQLERENADLRKQLEQAEGILREIEAQLGCQKGGSIASIIHMKDAVRELYKRLEQAEPRCIDWRHMAYAKLGAERDKMLSSEVDIVQRFIGELTSPASPTATAQKTEKPE